MPNKNAFYLTCFIQICNINEFTININALALVHNSISRFPQYLCTGITSVFEFLVTNCNKLPLSGRFFPEIHSKKSLQTSASSTLPAKYHVIPHSAINSRGVQVVKSALGIHFRFMGVSKVIGKIATTRDWLGRPLLGPANDLVK